jgi:hypothetical protein
LFRPTTLLLALALLAATVCGGVALERRSHASAVQGPVELKVAHIRQESLLCVPTSAAMILGYYGDPQSPRRLKTLSRGRVYDPRTPFDDFSLTRFQDLLRGTAALGYAWREKTYADTPAGFEAGMRTIEREVAAGRPVMTDISLGKLGHTIVVAGADPKTRTLVVIDPDTPAPGRHLANYAQFQEVWNERSYGGRFRALILTRPKGESAA